MRLTLALLSLFSETSPSSISTITIISHLNETSPNSRGLGLVAVYVAGRTRLLVNAKD